MLSWILYSARSLKQQSTGRHVASLGHIILIPCQQVFALNDIYTIYIRSLRTPVIPDNEWEWDRNISTISNKSKMNLNPLYTEHDITQQKVPHMINMCKLKHEKCHNMINMCKLKHEKCHTWLTCVS